MGTSFQVILALIFVIVPTLLAQHNPLKDPNVCGRPICKGSGKFKYSPGTQQTYKYSVEVRSLFNGTSKNESSLYVEGTVTLDFLTPCDGLLTLYDVKLSENAPDGEDEDKEAIPHANSDEFAEIITEHSLRFAFNDGIISEICPQDGEKNWVLNFKRGLLSMLHNTMKRLDLDHSAAAEEDVRGRCPTQYTVMGAKEISLLVEKTKDLGSCQGRDKLHSMVQSVPYSFRSKLQQGKNLLKSSSRCEMSIDHNIYKEITCEESHVLQPFSNQDAGATTIVVQRLVLDRESSSGTLGDQPEITRRTSLMFDHVPSVKPTQGELRTSRELIKKMCQQSTDDVQIDFSDLFTKFIQTLRILSYPSLGSLYEHSGTTCSTGRKHLLDALPYVGSTASVILMKDIILKQGVPESTTKEWMMSLAFIVRPDEDMMTAVSQLLKKQKSIRTEVIFSISAMAHTYCSQHADCADNEAVKNILQFIETSILEAYEGEINSRETKDKIIIALKSLGNIGVISEGFNKYLIHLVGNKQLDVAIRVAAVEVYRRLKCEQSRDYFENIFRDQDEDVELRIAAYLQIMRCPNYRMIQTVKHSLENEEVNQVGSFVWSHLNNLMKSSIPSRVEIQGILSDVNLEKKFSSDVRKFSHNREGSIYFEEYDVGASYENNVIFSPSSYVPRSAMLNLTVDVFGESINLMEVYGRFEGFEHYLESMFGPRGPLNSKKLMEKIPKTRWTRSVSEAPSAARDRAGRKGENEILKSQIDELPNVMENSFGEPKVSLGLKVFGNELKYATFDGEEEISSAVRALNPVDHLKRILSGKEINYNKAAMFLDSNYVVPSGAGLPITLSALGTASINLKLFGSLHSSNFLESKELDLKTDIRLSGSLDLKGVMSVDAFYASTGIKLSSSMYTSSAVEGNIKIKGTKLVSVKFSLPRQTTEIFGAKSELIVMKQNVEQVQDGLSKTRLSKSICSWPAVDKIVGLKLCGEYHFMNVTKLNNAPYFVLAGPAGFRLFLEKSDPTAKIYSFEYKWTDRGDSSVVSLTFDTPGSSFRRLLAANFTVDRQSQNVTLFMQSTAGTLLARGKYKNTVEEKYLQLALNINDKKHFDFNSSLIRKNSRHGYTYFPRVYLAVNGERVLELHGTLKWVSKKDISQYDVDLKFRTKRLTSELFGYILKAEASVATNLKLDYKFAHTKEQRVNFEFSLANRSPKNMVDIRGTCSLISTSYPNYNFDANLRFQRGNGPIEIRFDLSSSPLPADHPEAEFHKLKFEWVFSYKSSLDSTRTLNTIASVSRQSTGLNLKGQFSYEIRGSDVNALVLVKYGSDKKVSVTVFWSHPRTTLEQMEGRINITVPSFASMILHGKLQEKAASDYIVELSGTWFSGHSASARGFYQDKSTPRSHNHHLKLLIKSPSFQDVNTDFQFYRDNNEIKVELKADHDKNSYGLLARHNVVSPEKLSTEVKLKYKAQHYSMLSSVYLGDHREISVELHVDQIRDIHFAAWEHYKEGYKAAGLEVKWDANRDNNQKLVVSANFTKLAYLNYKGNLLLSYPGRTILANFDFHLQSRYFNTLARLSWADEQSFAIGLEVDYDVGKQTYILIKSQIVTPFDRWQKTSIIGSYHHHGNLYRVNGSVFWKHDEYVVIDLLEDYSIDEAGFECKLKCSLASTLENIPSLSAVLNHSHNTSKIDTAAKLMLSVSIPHDFWVDQLLRILKNNVTKIAVILQMPEFPHHTSQYDPEHVIDVRSNWKIDGNDHYTNLTGTIIATTPFNVCRKGYLIGKVHFTTKKYLIGFANLDVDHKKFTVSLEGNLLKLTNSMVVLNVTTPLEKYKQLEGRFGFSEERRHIVAQVQYPTGMMGFEVLIAFDSFTDFDVKLSLGTPISFLQQVIVVGRLKRDRADFRIGWNSMTLGFAGVWHYVNVIDFEYSYKIYTPIFGYEENGIVAKLIFKEGLDFEVSVGLSNYKLGMAILGAPKRRILKELGINTGNIYGRKSPVRTWPDQEQDTEPDYYEDKEDGVENIDEEGDEYEDPLSWTGFVEIDAIIYPTMQGTLDIDQEGPLYIVQGKLSLPDGTATLTDEFEFIDVLTMKNDLKITTPYESIGEIVSLYHLEIRSGRKYDAGLSLDYRNGSRWIRTGAKGHYTIYVGQDREESYNVALQVHSPLESFPQLVFLGSLEHEANIYRTNLSVTTNSNDISVTTKTEVNGDVMDGTVLMEAKTSLFTVPWTNVTFKKDFRPDDKIVEVHVFAPEVLKREIYFRTNWLIKSLKQFHTFIWFDTPYKGMENTLAGIKVLVTDNTTETRTMLRAHPLEIDMNSTFTGSIFRANSDINFNGKHFPVSLSGRITQVAFNKKDIVGDLNLKDKLFRVTGYVTSVGTLPVDVHIQIVPQDRSDPLIFEYKLNPTATGYALSGNIHHSSKFAKFEANMTARNQYDWQIDTQIDTSHEVYNRFLAQINATTTSAGSSISLEARTPLPKLENVKLGSSIVASGHQHYGRGYFELTEHKGDLQVDWIWLFLENMYINVTGNYQNKEYSSQSRVEGFYINPDQLFQFLKAGADINIDALWSAGSNVTLSLPNYQNISFEAHLKLPASIKEVYSLDGKLRYEKGLRSIEYLAKYRTAVSKKKYGSWGNVSLVDSTHMGGDVELEWNSKSIKNHLNLNRSENVYIFLYKLRTPKYEDKETLVTEITYGSSGDYHNITCEAFYPEKRSVAFFEVDYKQLANMNGTVNVTIPFRNVNYTGAHFATKTNAGLYLRYLEVFWPKDKAVLDCKCVTETGISVLESNTTGVLVVEVPLATRHVANVNFAYQERPRQSTGTTTVDYNGSKVLEGNYNCLSESRAGFDKEMIHVEIRNKLVPIGADYVHGYEYGIVGGAPSKEDYEEEDDEGGYNSTPAPSMDAKHLHLYHLQNRTKFNITGEMNVRTTSTGRKMAFSTTHSNRTVKLWTGYDVLDQQFKQHSRLELSPSTWIEYDLDLLNKTVDETSDAQRLQINVAYPRRNFTALASYNVSVSSLLTDVSLEWDRDRKTVQAGFDWRRAGEHREEVQLQIRHPSFQKDVVFLGEYGYDNKKLLDAQLTVDYSPNPEQTLKIGTTINDNTHLSAYNYTYNLWAIHDATNLNLKTRGGFYWNADRYATGHCTDYKRSYLPLQTAEALARLDLTENEIEIKKQTGQELSSLWTKYGGSFPVYWANLSTSHQMNNASGGFYFDFKEKLVQLDYNMTTDGSQSLHMYGLIPDARSAAFDIWRDYEDIRVSDVSYYLRLNHSRLITSRLLWRPDLVHDIQTGIRTTVKLFYDDVLESINNTKQYIRSETNDAIHGVWNDAKPLVQNFLDDLRQLRVVESDFEEFKKFLNQSYNANEFYIKDIINMTMTMFDELAIKAHLQSLPAIVSEIWEVMGESGMKIKKSVTWFVEQLKMYYKHMAEFIRGLLDGDPIDHLSEAFKNIVERYDAFIKEMHVAFIRYMEQLWAQTYALIVNNWHKTLAAIEPTFIKMIHYLETILWNTSQEFLDFLYIRKSELIESPYFVQFSNFTHDLDKFYRDITGNNTLASVRKYVMVAWNFLKEKYFSMVPFGKELQDVVSEILDELNELRNLPSIQFLTEKLNDVYENITWICEYFDVENRLHHFIALLHRKLTDMSQTALEAENRYRVAKTNFIFDPLEGVMLLEQKLPMSWHAFNQTPKFQEIPELKTIYNVQKYFVSSHRSFWDFYYDYKAYTELSGWLPPFKAQALLVGSRYYMTFDRRYYDFEGNCSYLLATDYLDRNFSVVVSFDNKQKTHELLLLINKTIVNINVFTDTVKIGNGGVTLPAQIGDTFLYQEAEIVTAKSDSGFVLECNLKFDVCTFEVSGWYFGKTAGLWGTINNEPSDDFLTSRRTKAKPRELQQFVNSWALQRCNGDKLPAADTPQPTPPAIAALCDEFFTSKVSQLTTCFPRVSREPFLSMCMNSSNEEQACSSALAYINLCAFSNTPLRIPDVCVKCNSPNGTVLNEGQFIHVDVSDLPQSADTVFIIEAKDCNRKLRTLKNFDSVVEMLHKEYAELNLTNNRYAVVIFGGDAVYDQPRSLVINGSVFSDFRTIISHLDSIPTGNGSADIFGAITFASGLLFRPGVSKNFILIPCSECKEENMKLDYASLHQLLLESDVTLHILIKEEFSLQKMRESKIPFGIDRNKAYTKKDIRGLMGDVALRKQVSLPKATLGYCTPLALETNGTIFSIKNLENDKRANVKKFATVLAKRVAQTAKPISCVNCECTAFNTGVSYMECYPCTYPSRASIDYGFDEDMALSLMQPADDIFNSFERR